MIVRIAATSLLLALAACGAEKQQTVEEQQTVSECETIGEIEKQINEDRNGFVPDLVLSMTLDYETPAELGTHIVEPCDVLALDILILDEKFNSWFRYNLRGSWHGVGNVNFVSETWEQEIIRPVNQSTFENAVFYRRFYFVTSVEEITWNLILYDGSSIVPQHEPILLMTAELKR